MLHFHSLTCFCALRRMANFCLEHLARGVDQTLGFIIVRDLNDLLRFYRRQVIGGLKVLLEHMQGELNPTSTLPALADKMYKVALERTSKLWPWFAGAEC